MQVWFSKFIRGRVFSVLFCILGFGLTIYLSSRLGIPTERTRKHRSYSTYVESYFLFFQAQ